MALIKLRKANEIGEEVGTVIVNTDQIAAIIAGQNTTELQMADGHPRWAKETHDEVAALVKLGFRFFSVLFQIALTTSSWNLCARKVP